MTRGVPRDGFWLCSYCLEPTNRPDGMHSSCHVLANPHIYTEEDIRRAKRTERRRQLRHGARPDKSNTPKPCVCMETGEVFPSRASAAKKYATSSTSWEIKQSIDKGYACNGLHFKDMPASNEKP